ncbi:MAG: hypothetical protein HY674_03485 [Chloroflexi bacterium]|nr:hypothetical protein [Chloroflexota bacterium]
MVGGVAFSLGLLAQYDSAITALHLTYRATQLPQSVPSSFLDGIFAPRLPLFGLSLPAGLIAAIGLLLLFYAIGQSSFRLSIRSRLLYDWYVPFAPAVLIAGGALWFSTFSPWLKHETVPEFFVLAIQTFIWSDALLLPFTGAPKELRSRAKVILGFLCSVVALFILRAHFQVDVMRSILIAVLSVPLAALAFMAYSMLVFFKTIELTGEYHDYYHRSDT